MLDVLDVLVTNTSDDKIGSESDVFNFVNLDTSDKKLESESNEKDIHLNIGISDVQQEKDKDINK